jgi:hypothetical protein
MVALVAIAALSMAARLAVAQLLPSIIHQDEIFQYLEQAHRLVFGTGLAPWEYVVGLRSWLFPGVLAAVMELSRPFGDQPAAALIAVAAFMAAASLTTVVCGFLWGWRVGGLSAAVAAGVLNGAWFEIVYFSGHTLSETLAADLLVPGLYLACPGGRKATWRGLFLGGVLLGLAATLRLQIAPAIAAGGVAICGRSLKDRYLPLILGGLIPVVAAGLLDWATWDWPFQSMALNLWINVVQGVAADFSKTPPWQYLSLAVTYWSGAFMLIVILALVGARKLPVPLLVAAVIVLTHSALAHKEYRFVYPALPLLVTLAGIGSADIAARIASSYGRRPTGLAVTVGLPLFWIVTSLILAREREFYPLWFRDEGSIRAMRIIDADPQGCGVAIYPKAKWDRNGGYAHLRAGVTLYGRSDGDPDALTSAYNYIIGYAPADFSTQGFIRLQCWSEPPGRTIVLDPICLWRRPGACEPDAAPRLTGEPPAFLLAKHPEWFETRGD